MGDAKKKREKAAERLKTPEGIAERDANQRAAEDAYARRMASTLAAQKRQMAAAAAGRFSRQWAAKPWEEVLAALHPQRDDAMAMAFTARSPDAYRAAMALVAFDADITAGGVEQLAKSIEPQLPLRLWESNDKEALEKQREERAREIAFQTYHLALAEALGDVSLLQSLAASPDADDLPPEPEKGELGPPPEVVIPEGGVEAAPEGSDGVDDAGNPIGTEYDDAGNPEPPDLGETDLTDEDGNGVEDDDLGMTDDLGRAYDSPDVEDDEDDEDTQP